MAQNASPDNLLFPSDRFYKLTEVETLTGVPRRLLWLKIHQKKLPAFRISRHWLLRGSDLNKYFQAGRTRVRIRPVVNDDDAAA